MYPTKKVKQIFKPFIQISPSLNELFLFLEYVRYIICLFRREKINSIGGQMGLLLGASLLSLLEIFKFLLKCVIYLIKICWNRIACTTNVSKVKDAGIAFEN